MKKTIILGFLLLSTFLQASGQFQLPPSRKRLIRANAELTARVDSLRARLDSSLAAIKAYEQAVPPEEYTDDDYLDFEHYNPGRTDSLLSIWYIQQHLSVMDSVSVPEPDDFVSSVTDEQYIARLAAMNAFFTLPYNDVVRSYIIRYSEKSRGFMSSILSLCYYYMPIFEEALARYSLPHELKALAIVESALNPKARSRAGAVGMWQFMYPAAKSYGLNINSYYDERMDPYRSADAAARYLRDAYRLFGDWSLAISSYNCGPGNVRKAIARAGGKTGYWDIYPYLPRETRNYVPALVGVLYTLYYRQELGIEPSPFTMPVHVDTFHVHHKLHFKQVNELIGVPIEEVRRINPQYVHDIIPGDATNCILRLPYEYTEKYVALEDSLYKYKADELLSDAVIKDITSGAAAAKQGNMITYKVRNGDTLGGIAKRNHTTVSALKKWNNLRSDKIRIGQVLKIYR